MLYSGTDLHKTNSMFTTINDNGAVLNQKRLPNNESVILDYLFAMGNEHKAVVESTTDWYWLSDLLNDHGVELILAHAKHLKAILMPKLKQIKSIHKL